MQILRIIIRFLIIAIAVGLLVFLSISLFKLIPAGINQLASATVSLGQPKTTVIATSTQKDATPAPVTNDGLNGVYDTKGDIVVLNERSTSTPTKQTSTAGEAQNKPVYTQTYKPTYTKTPSSRTVYYPKVYYPTQPTVTGRKNLKITLSSIGVIRNGVYIPTNSFNTTDTVSMRFMISNAEDTPTGAWTLRAEMPATIGADKVKIIQAGSLPGVSSLSGEVRFDGIDLSQGTPVIRIYLDVNNQVIESDEGDNLLAVELRNVTNTTSPQYGTCWNGSYYYNCTTNTNTIYSNTNTCWNGSYYYNCDNGSSSNNTCWNGSYYYNCTDGYNGTLPNLSVTSFEIGRYVNGTFYAQTTFNYGETVVVRARVRNNGGYFSSSWQTRLNVYDANNYSRDLTNGSTPSLGSNSETLVTYEIPNLTRGSNRLTLYLDTANNVSESNEGDNNSTITVQVY